MSGAKRDPRNSHYQGALASNKYFDGKSGMTSKNIPSTGVNRNADPLNYSATSFHSVKQMDSEQQKKLQKQTRPAFALRGSVSAKGGRSKENEAVANVAQDDVLDDSYSQSEQSRQEIMNMLARREKDKEEIELESCFSDLQAQALAGGQANKEHIEKLANQSLTDLKEMQEGHQSQALVVA